MQSAGQRLPTKPLDPGVGDTGGDRQVQDIALPSTSLDLGSAVRWNPLASALKVVHGAGGQGLGGECLDTGL
jgi:hypothetical protein